MSLQADPRGTVETDDEPLCRQLEKSLAAIGNDDIYLQGKKSFGVT